MPKRKRCGVGRRLPDTPDTLVGRSFARPPASPPSLPGPHPPARPPDRRVSVACVSAPAVAAPRQPLLEPPAACFLHPRRPDWKSGARAFVCSSLPFLLPTLPPMSRFYRGGGGGGPSPGFAKPENALARARELVAVGHKGAALRALHDVLSSKRHRTWSKVLEDVAVAYFDLCVDLRRARYAKDGLIHYRNVCQQVSEDGKGWVALEWSGARGVCIFVRCCVVWGPEAGRRAGRGARERKAAAGRAPIGRDPTLSHPLSLPLLHTQVNVSSLEDVVKRLLTSSTTRAEEALTAAAEASDALLDVDDLEAGAPTPDALLAAAAEAGGKGAAAAAGREAVTPWFRFAWDVHRAALDVLRNSARLESLYAASAAAAVSFCVKHRRTTEFRRLCDVLRSHLATLQKSAARATGADAARDRPDLANADTLSLMLDARHDQLRAAVDLGMWQEAFRCVEDVAAVVALAGGKRAPKAAAATAYFSQLTRVFGVAGAHLYSGHAWLKLLALSRAGVAAGGTGKSALPPGDAAALAANAALAALAAPPVDAAASATSDADADAERDRTARVAALLGLTAAPDRRARASGGGPPPLTRAALVSDLATRGVVAMAPPPVADIHALLETEFAPLDLCTRLAPLLDQLAATAGATTVSAACPVPTAGDLSSYVAPLRRVALLRTLQQAARAYSRLPLDALAAAVPFFSRGELDALVADAAARGAVSARIDHAAGVLVFGGPTLDADALRGALALCAARAAAALARTRGDRAATAARAAAVAAARDSADTEHKRALARKIVIERRKEAAERAAAEAEREEEEKRAVAARLAEAAEEERRRTERAAREEARLRAEMREREQEEARALLEAAQRKGGASGAKAAAAAKAVAVAPGAALPDGATVDKRALLDEVLSEQAKARAEAEKRAARATRAADHFVRAARQEEAPLIEAAHAARLQEDEELFHSGAAEYAAQHKAAWEADVVEKARLARAAADAASFGAALEERRAAAFAALAAKRAAAAAARRERARADRAAARAREYVRLCRLQLDARRREAAEAEAAEEEEREARAAEERRARESSRPPPPSGGGGGGGGGYVPPSRRGGSGFVPPALRGERRASPPPPRDRSPPRRDDGPPTSGGGGRWMPPSRRGDAAPPPAGGGGGGGGYVPPSRRGAAPPPPERSGGDDAPPPARVERRW